MKTTNLKMKEIPVFIIEVWTNRGFNDEQFGVMSYLERIDDNAVSRQLGNPTEFESENEAKQAVKRFYRQETADQFDLRIVEIGASNENN